MVAIALEEIALLKMKIPSMFKTPKYRSFEFKPRYYDAEKEAFEQRVNMAMQSDANSSPETEAVKQRLRNHFKNKKSIRTPYSSKAGNIRIIVIIAILTALSFWLLK